MSRRPNIYAVLACAAILIAGIAAYSNSLDGPFIFDDFGSIRDNLTLRHFPAWENFVPPPAVWRRPVVNFTFALNHAVGGLDVRGYHAGNLLIHLLTALLLFGIVRRTLLAGRWQTVQPSIVAFAVALIWAVHPLLTESVSYLTQRTELMMGLFFLLTLYCAIRGFSSSDTRSYHQDTKSAPSTAHDKAPRTTAGDSFSHSAVLGALVSWWLKSAWFIGAVAACALGMGSKEVMATAPILVLLYDRCFLTGSFREALRRRRAFYIGLAATWAVLGGLLLAYPMRQQPGGFSTGVGPWEYARTQPGVILHYLRLSFWPNPLCVDYGWPIATSAWQIVPAGAVIVALLAGCLWALRRAPALGFLGAWFFLILSPSSSFMPLAAEVAAERRMYLPLAAVMTGAVLAAVWCWNRAWPLATGRWSGRALACAAILSAAALGFLTARRNAEYRDAVALWRQTVRVAPDNPGAHCNLGYALEHREPHADREADYAEAMREYDRTIALKPDATAGYVGRGNLFLAVNRYAEAIREYDQAVAFDPHYAVAWCNRGAACARFGRSDEALRDEDQAIALDPEYAEAYVNRGNVRASANQCAEAIRDYDRAIALMPDDADAWFDRGNVYARTGPPEKALSDLDRAIALNSAAAEPHVSRGVILAAAHHDAEAIREYDQAIALAPDDAHAWFSRGVLRARTGRAEEALHDLDRAIELKRDDAEAYYNRGNLHLDAHRCDEAVRDFDKAIALQPDYADAWFNRANAYVAAGRPAEAIRDYSRAIELRPNDPDAWYNRATVRARLKQNREALADFQMARKLGATVPEELLRAVAPSARTAH